MCGGSALTSEFLEIRLTVQNKNVECGGSGE